MTIIQFFLPESLTQSITRARPAAPFAAAASAHAPHVHDGIAQVPCVCSQGGGVDIGAIWTGGGWIGGGADVTFTSCDIHDNVADYP